MHPILYALENFLGIPARFTGDIAESCFDDYFDYLVYFEVLYVLLIYYGPKFMEKREPIQLKPLVTLWNLLLSLFSIGGTIGCSCILFYLLQHKGFYETTCHFNRHYVFDGEFAFWIFAFLLSKIPEMLDTVFLVLQKKPIIFLHWYHHLTVAVFCWYAGNALIPSGFYYATMNYLVHSIMYFYYFLCCLGLRKYIRPIAPLITGMQLLQMVVGTVVVIITAYYSYIDERGCDVDRRTIRMGLAMYGSYFFLFFMLFIHLYLTKDTRKKKAGAKKEKAEAAKTD